MQTNDPERAPSPEPKPGDVWMVALKDEHPCIKKGRRYTIESRDDLGFAVKCGCEKPAFAPPEVFLASAEVPPTATLRDHFAMAALAWLLADPGSPGPGGAATAAYEYADAMMRERKREASNG